MAFWRQEFAQGKKLLETLGLEIVPPWMIAAKTEVEDWCMRMCLSAEVDMRTQNVDEADRVVYTHMLSSMKRMPRKPKGETCPITEQECRNEVASEIMDHISK